MKRFPIFLFSLFALAQFATAASTDQAQETRTPVLLELFTSEGCSSCPPADQLLSKLDREQPFQGVDLIVIGEHVDYWDRAGWTDPYSSAAFTARQQHYSTLLHFDEVFTPQLIVDGTLQFVGSNWPKAKAAIETASHAPKLPISLALAEGRSHKITAKVGSNPAIPAGDVYLVLAADSTDTQVKAGENSGRHLSHTSVAYSIGKIGKTSPDSPFEKTVSVPAHGKWGSTTRVIVLVQDPATGHILGASQTKL